MKLTDLQRYEIRAEAFRIMTGHTAPGKHASPETHPARIEFREVAWKIWNERYGVATTAMLSAFNRIMPEAE
jgi:hypothetical protein